MCKQVLESGLRPNTTTFNALIAAYSKAGNLDKVRSGRLAETQIAFFPPGQQDFRRMYHRAQASCSAATTAWVG